MLIEILNVATLTIFLHFKSISRNTTHPQVLKLASKA